MLQEQVTGMLAAIQDDLRSGESKIYEGIVLTPHVPTVAEVTFRNYFLPCFAGMVQPPNWMLNWIQIAGSPTAEVAVVDAQGQELFRVPPLLATTKVILVNRAGSLADIFSRQELLKNSLNGKHNEYVFQELDRKRQELGDTGHEDTAARWQQIFTHYGVQPPGAAPAGVSEDSDIFEY